MTATTHDARMASLRTRSAVTRVFIALFLLVGLLIVLTVNEKRARADAATPDLVIAVS